MAKKFVDKVRVASATLGQGTLTLGGAYDASFFSLAEAMTAAGAVDGDTTDYVVSEGTDFEIVRDGLIGASGTTITRGTTVRSKISGSSGTTKLTLTGAGQVRFFPTAESLNQMILDVFTKLDKSGGAMTGVLTLSGDASGSLDAVTKQQLDAATVNVGKRQRVRAATTANITISTALNNGDLLDDVTLATGDLVLVKNQSSAQQNGVYVVGVTPVRAAEFDTYNEHSGSLIAVAEGTANADTLWLCTSNDGGTLNTTAITFAAFTALDATSLGAAINNGTAKTTPVGADKFGFWDSVSGLFRVVTYTNLLAALGAAFSTVTRVVNPQTGTTYTLVIGDAGNVVTMNNAAANTLTIPPNSLVAFPTGTQIDIAQKGAGKTTIAAGAGVTINNTNKSLAAQYAGVMAIKEATDTWTLYGTTIA